MKAIIYKINKVVNYIKTIIVMLEWIINYLRDEISAFSKSLFTYLRGDNG